MYERGHYRGRGGPGRGGQGGGFPPFSRGARGGPRFINRPPPPGHFQGGPPPCPPWGFPGIRPGMPPPGFCPRNGPSPGFRPGYGPRGLPPPRTDDGMHHPFNHRENNKRKQAPGQQDNTTKQKKKKVDKRELPENNRFYCDMCDRGFKTEEKYKEHTDGHEQCKVEGCSYVAAPKLVKLHYEWQHRTGLAKKIWKLESKEDIEKWRNARKRNFPTQENIAKKKERMEAMKSRGEVLETQFFGKMKGKGKGRFVRSRGGRGRGRWRSQHNDNEQDCMNLRQISPEQGGEAPQVKKSRDPSVDPLAYVLDDSKQGSDDEVRTDTAVSGQLSLAGGLGSLAAAYADSSEEEESTKPPPADGKLPLRPESERATPREDKSRCPRRHRKKNKPFSHKRHLTLLQKLLAPEVRHERNVILQCVRHIINRNFFESESTHKEILKAKNSTLPTTGPMSHMVDDEIWENGL